MEKRRRGLNELKLAFLYYFHDTVEIFWHPTQTLDNLPYTSKMFEHTILLYLLRMNANMPLKKIQTTLPLNGMYNTLSLLKHRFLRNVVNRKMNEFVNYCRIITNSNRIKPNWPQPLHTGSVRYNMNLRNVFQVYITLQPMMISTEPF